MSKQQESKESKKHPKGLGDSPKGWHDPKPSLKTGTARQPAPKVIIRDGTGKK
jgi:hypothetical protein